MPVQLDIVGNFAAGQKATLDRRRARQAERANDYALAQEEEKLQGRRDNIRQQEETYGLQPMDFGQFQTNDDPLLFKIMNWWKQRRANRVLPSNMMPGQQQTVQDENNQMQPDMSPAQTYPMGAMPAYDTSPAQTYPLGARPAFRNGGAIPRYAEGGEVADEAEMIRRRAAANRARTPAEVTARTETAIPVRPGMVARAGSALRGGVNAAGKRFAPIALGTTAIENYNNDTERYRKRFGFEPGSKETGFWNDVGVRTLGAMSDLGNVLSFGAAGNLYRDNQPDEAAPASPQPASPEAPAAIPKTPDEAIAQQAIQEGTQMAQQAQEQNAPPGAIDFSKVDFNAGDIPNMPVKDWIDYRARMVRNLMAQGATPVEAHAQVTRLQQQGFIDYAQQALMHLQAGNPGAAASALRAAYQYFPNGTDVQLGAQTGKDGQPVLIGMGRDEETGKPKGPPMIINSERLATMIENFSKPDAFRAWTKDWRDEQFNRQKFEEVEKPAAQHTMNYQNRMANAAELNAEANMADANARGRAAGGRKQVDLDRANAAFTNAVELLGINDQAQADKLMSAMAQIYERSNWQYPQVIEFVRQAQSEGRLDEVMQALGLGE